MNVATAVTTALHIQTDAKDKHYVCVCSARKRCNDKDKKRERLSKPYVTSHPLFKHVCVCV